MKANFFLRMLRAGVLIVCFVWAGRCFADKITTLDEAYQHLISAESKWHDGPTPKDREALAVLKGNLEATKRMFVKTFLEGAKEDGPAGTLILLFPADERLDVLREVVRHYEYGDLETPFTGALAASGTGDDMEVIKGIFIRHPNADGVGELAALMASTKNPHAHEALMEFRKQIPGKWQERFEIKRFFAARLPQGRQPEGPENTAPTQSPAREANPSIEPPASSAKDETSRPLNPPVTPEKRLSLRWIAGGLIAILGFLFYLVRRRRGPRRAAGSDGQGETSS